MSIETVNSEGVSRVQIEREITAECPYDDVIDRYEVKIVFTPGDETPEYRYLSEWLDTVEEAEISQERVCKEIHGIISPIAAGHVRVSVSGMQYGMRVTVVMK